MSKKTKDIFGLNDYVIKFGCPNCIRVLKLLDEYNRLKNSRAKSGKSERTKKMEFLSDRINFFLKELEKKAPF